MTSLTERAADLAAEHPTVPFGRWTDAVRRDVLSFRFDCARPGSFAGMIRTRSAAGLRFTDMISQRHAAYRERATITDAEAGYYVMTLQLSGQLWLTQDGRRALLTPGRFALYDSARPVTLVCTDDYRSTCIRFPKTAVDPDALHDLTATAFDYAPGLSSTVWDTIITVNRNLPWLGDRAPAAARQAMGMVLLWLRADSEGVAAGEPAGDEALLRRVRGYIDEHLADPGLGVEQLAAAHHVSPRRLHYLFAPTGVTVGEWIRARRVRRCRRELADPALARVPVAAIGARAGFSTASHFGQVFKRYTGMSPAAFRRAALSTPNGPAPNGPAPNGSTPSQLMPTESARVC